MKNKLPNNRINTDWQFRCASSPDGYAERSLVEMAIEKDEKTALERGKPKEYFFERIPSASLRNFHYRSKLFPLFFYLNSSSRIDIRVICLPR